MMIAPLGAAGQADRTILISDAGLTLAELLDGEKEAVDTECATIFDEDPDDRPVLFQLAERRIAVIDTDTGELLGTMVYRARPYGDTMGCTSWNMGIKLRPSARGQGLGATAGMLLTRYLFDTTELNRVEAYTEVANLPGQRSLEKVGFHPEAVLRGVHLRGGKPRDLVLYSLLRTDLPPEASSRTVLARRGELALANLRPDDHRTVLAAGPAHGPANRRIIPVNPYPMYWGSLIEATSHQLLGTANWHTVDHAGHGAWNIGITANSPDITAAGYPLVADHLFATTHLERVEATVDADDSPTRNALEAASFRLEGTLRSSTATNLVLYGLLRDDRSVAG
jgi:RimJ/RimL family protein N-acetyltransferase